MDIHTYFNLTYANALILDRRHVTGELAEMIGQLERAFRHVPRGHEYVLLAGEEWLYDDLGPQEMALLDIVTNVETVHEGCEHDDEDDEYECERENLRWYDWRGDEHDRHERLTVPSETLEQARAAQRLVLHRALLQSMPESWQERFVELHDELVDELDDDGIDSYEIRVFDAAGRRVEDPVPHYRRGRTYIEPLAEAFA